MSSSTWGAAGRERARELRGEDALSATEMENRAVGERLGAGGDEAATGEVPCNNVSKCEVNYISRVAS